MSIRARVNLASLAVIWLLIVLLCMEVSRRPRKMDLRGVSLIGSTSLPPLLLI